MKLDYNTTQLIKVADIKIPDIFSRRLKTGINKIDVLFDEGVLPGSAMTLTAQAGCGKTTFMLQMLQGMTQNGYKVGYFSGEESIYQLAYTAGRIGVQDVQIANETDIDSIKQHMNNLDIVVIDSFQALTSSIKMNSRTLEKHAVQTLTKHAKNAECVVVFIMHLTKSGDLKGGTIVPHTVDANLKISRISDTDNDNDRVIYFEKNRFGPLNELECSIERTGYNFECDVVREQKTDTEKASKTSSKQLQIEELLELISACGDRGLSIGEAIKHFDSSYNTMYSRFRDLTVTGKVNKYGRGQEAIYTL